MAVKRKTKQTKKEKPKIPRTSRKITSQHKAAATVRHDHDVPYKPGDLCFYIGCEQIVGKNVRSQFKHNLVVHESDLPHGRGWSPLTWQILEGSNSISIVLFEATESVDAGKIYLKDSLLFTGLELIEELREVQAVATIKMCQRFVDDYPALVIDGIEQVGDPTFYEKRTPSDSQINKSRSIESLFPLLRVADYERYPVCFDIKGARFRIKVEAL